jgi:hypothetical protein
MLFFLVIEDDLFLSIWGKKEDWNRIDDFEIHNVSRSSRIDDDNECFEDNHEDRLISRRRESR